MSLKKKQESEIKIIAIKLQLGANVIELLIKEAKNLFDVLYAFFHSEVTYGWDISSCDFSTKTTSTSADTSAEKVKLVKVDDVVKKIPEAVKVAETSVKSFGRPVGSKNKKKRKKRKSFNLGKMNLSGNVKK